MKKQLTLAVVTGIWAFSHLVACAKKDGGAPAPGPMSQSGQSQPARQDQQSSAQAPNRIEYGIGSYYELFGYKNDEVLAENNQILMENLNNMNNRIFDKLKNVPEEVAFNPCVTGYHIFYGKDHQKDRCEALKDDVLNRGCSPAARKTKFLTLKDHNGKEICSGLWKTEKKLTNDSRVEERYQYVSKSISVQQLNLQQIKSQSLLKEKMKSELRSVLKFEEDKAEEKAQELSARGDSGIASFVALKEAYRFAKAKVTAGDDTGLSLTEEEAIELAEKLASKDRPTTALLAFERAILYALADKYGLQFIKTYVEITAGGRGIFKYKAYNSLGLVRAISVDEAIEFAHQVVDSANPEAYLKVHREVFNQLFRLDPETSEGNLVVDSSLSRADRSNKEAVRVRAKEADGDLRAWQKAKDQADSAADSAAISAKAELEQKEREREEKQKREQRK